jgi:phenylalanyl-tRNA synthetase beta chain
LKPSPLTPLPIGEGDRKGEYLIIPFWRKDLHYKADIAEEIARITGYDEIVSTIPEVKSGAVIQDSIYKLKNDARSFFANIGYFDMYNYSFVNEELMKKCL